MARRAALLAIAAGAIALIVALSTSGSGTGHQLTIIVANATNVVPGQYVKEAGVKAGTVQSITAVDGGHYAKLVLSIDDSAWPLTRGTTMELHWGGTVAFVNRYIEITRGPATNPPMATDGVFPAADFSMPGEFDSLINTFNASTRVGLKAFLQNAGITLGTASPNLARAIEAAPAALAQTSAALGDLDSNESALHTLVRSGAQVVAAVNRADPGIQPLVTNAATTFAALARRAAQLSSTLQTAPSTLAQTRQTLAQAEPTLQLAKIVSARVAPGVTQVERVSRPLDDLLVTLKRVGPDAISALSTAYQATPSLNQLLVKARTVLPRISSIGSQSVTSLQCVRPYTPDIIGFTTDWADFLSAVDGKDHYFRAQVQTLIPASFNNQIYNSAQMKKLFPWISYVFPPPPGFAAGQPWYLPQCNEGPNTVNPNADPENNASLPQLPSATATSISLPGSVK